MSGRVRRTVYGYLDEDIPTLQENIYEYLSDNLSVICVRDQLTELKFIHDDILLPSEICDRFLEYHQKSNRDVDDSFVNIFRDTQKTPLKYVHLRNSSITSEGLEILFRHNLTSLSMWYCSNINLESRHLLAKYGGNLKSLELGLDVDLLRYPEPNEKSPVDFQLNFPNLRRLVLHGVVLHYRLQFNHLHDLVYLDLTQCFLSFFNLGSLSLLPNLTTLILHNIWPIANHLHVICRISTLKCLDISVGVSTNGQGTYDLADQTLEMLVENLPNLTHLDISGTNLAGTGVAQKESNYKTPSDIAGLSSRTSNPLQFLGLYHTAHWACKRHDIPALEIAGDANEKQILTAARYYYDRPAVLTSVLNDLYHLFRFETCQSVHEALDVVLTAMDRHLKYKHMQISGSATLFYIVKGQDRAKFGTPLKNHIIRTLLNGMQMHISDDTMLRNGYLTFCQFQMPHDVVFEYERLITVLLHGVSNTEQEGFVQRIAIYLLNTLACQVDGAQKLFLGDLNVISTMLSLIQDRLSRNVSDDVMEVAWSTMWNVTDETAINCKRFLDGKGMEYFLTCLRIFPDRHELLRNMMGLLGNVAEVKWLRPRLMTTEFIDVFSDLLDSESDGIEVSYNAAGVLAHIASDGDAAWVIETPTRANVLVRMVKAIELWNLTSERNINYRSFEPILSLVRCYDTPACQHWAAWALANLTQVYPTKYCTLLEQENGREILSELIEDPRPYKRIKELAQMVLDECDKEAKKLDG
ncbi:protein zer-1 homolog [Condylostylus longicornis]|uniref:protein zer-1 homolog n=1 Tax=Condylostylus longicornis TaxID=2530218 RepID=UPI00244E5271|nr:protein zer-1 homolog [Condylostylus longicornis]